jgi:hypothetical protein
VSVSLVVSDNGDGTGGTATVAGSDVGSTNTLYRALFEGADGVPLTWVSVG